jgi:hypothetical protein
MCLPALGEKVADLTDSFAPRLKEDSPGKANSAFSILYFGENPRAF